jgi:flavin reductase (DIM6/NTAB) family NADH-FMN oxidoreductase RutF
VTNEYGVVAAVKGVVQAKNVVGDGARLIITVGGEARRGVTAQCGTDDSVPPIRQCRSKVTKGGSGVGKTVQTNGQRTVRGTIDHTVQGDVIESDFLLVHHSTVSNAAGSVDLVPALDDARFREVVGHYATGVVVVTAMSPSAPVGFTCQTFGSLSVDPQLVSFNARTTSSSWPQIRSIEQLAINVLTNEQESLARAFATSDSDKFEGVSWIRGELGAPLLSGALATIEGRLVAVSTHGDHDVAIVAVEHVSLHEGEPLVYYRRGYGSFRP